MSYAILRACNFTGRSTTATLNFASCKHAIELERHVLGTPNFVPKSYSPGATGTLQSRCFSSRSLERCSCLKENFDFPRHRSVSNVSKGYKTLVGSGFTLNQRRSYSGQGSKDDGGRRMLLLGLGAMGLAAFYGFYTGELYPDHGQNQWKKSSLSNDLSKEINKKIEEAEVAVEEFQEKAEEKLEAMTEAIELEIEAKEEAMEQEIEAREAQLEKELEEKEAAAEEEIVILEAKRKDVPKQKDEAAAAEPETIEKAGDKKMEGVGKEIEKQPTSEKLETKVVDEQEVMQQQQEMSETQIEKKELPEIPEYVPYVIVGAGTASHAACRSIRKKDPNAKVLIIGQEEVLPYMRPPLSKELWYSDDPAVGDTLRFQQWNGKQRSVFFEKESYFMKPKLLPTAEKGGIAVLTGHRVVSVDAEGHSIKLKNGTKIKYDKLLLATGGKPRNMPAFANASDDLKYKVTLFRTVADFRKLDKVSRQVEHIAVVGGGFLGSELACALAHRGKSGAPKVTQIFPESGNMAKVLPSYLSAWTTEKVRSEGVNVIPEKQISKVDLNQGKVVLSLHDDDKVEADHVIVCVGLEPDVDLAKSGGLEVDPQLGGFRVNSELEARSDVYVAGDAACFYDIHLGRRRVEHHDHAVVSGRLAGENMTGAKRSYWHQSMFWSDLGPDVGYEAIGLVDSTLPTVGVWAKATERDTPKAVVEATGESLRSETEEKAQLEPAADSTTIAPPVVAAEASREQESQYGKGIVFYMKGKIVVGIVLWNIFNRMPIARQIIKEGKEHEDLHELAKLFDLYKE